MCHIVWIKYAFEFFSEKVMHEGGTSMNAHFFVNDANRALQIRLYTSDSISVSRPLSLALALGDCLYDETTN